MIYVTFGIRGDCLLVHTKTALQHVASAVFTKRGQPVPMLMVDVFMKELEDRGGLKNVAGFFFEAPGDCVFLERDGEVHSFYATDSGVAEKRSLN